MLTNMVELQFFNVHVSAIMRGESMIVVLGTPETLPIGRICYYRRLDLLLHCIYISN